MGGAISILTENFNELYRGHMDSYDPERIVLVDIGDILDEMHQVIVAHGEQPIYGDFSNRMMDSFLFELYHDIGCIPNGERRVALNIGDLLDTAEQYFDCVKISSLQRQCWYVAAQFIIDRFYSMKLYCPRDHVHQLDFQKYRDGLLYLSRP